MSLKICFLAPSGYGKSTAIDILKKYWSLCNIKIAEPLYELQRDFYNKINTPLKEEQDGELLQFYGLKIRKENPTYLLDEFEKKLKLSDDNYDFVTNDDCRPYDYDKLKHLNFIFIKINGYKRLRYDHTAIDQNLKIEWQSEIPYDYEINNLSDINMYEKMLINLIKEVKNDHKVLYYTNPKNL